MTRDSDFQVRVTPTRTEIIIMATRTQNVLGEKGRRIRELTSVVQKRFNFPEGTVELYAEKVIFYCFVCVYILITRRITTLDFIPLSID